ncbi:MAG: hypothetical protein ACE1Z6_09905 [Candidatus Methylomirabilales bacterium]
MSGHKVQYSMDEIKTRTDAAFMVQRLAKEYQEEHPDASDRDALSAVVNNRDHARLVVKYLDHPLPVEG